MQRAANNLTSHQPRQLAAAFLERYNSDYHYLRNNIDELATLATTGDEAQMSEATNAIFEALVEPLSDSFDPDFVSLYIRLMAQIVQECRRLERCMDEELAGFGLLTEQDLIERAERIRPGSPASIAGTSPSSRPNITLEPHRDNTSGSEAVAAGSVPELGTVADRMKRVIILSRVTIGADVAITSVIIERLKRKFPQAALTLVGGAKSREIFGGDSRLDFAELEYGRRSTLMGRLGAWVDLVSLVRRVTAGLNPDEFLIVDPDSRLTQLGLLPVAPDSSYVFFPSREYMTASAEPLARLASDWSGQLVAVDGVQSPSVFVSQADLSVGGRLVEALRCGRTRPVVSVNFGVGNNDKKRVGPDFEAAIIDFLLAQEALVMLDRGAGQRESADTDALIARLGQSRQMTVIEAGETGLKTTNLSGPSRPDLLVWSGGAGLLAALITASDLYVGYDSAGQHIAAAVGTECIDVFAGYTGRRMIERWRPSGPGGATVIDAGHGRTVDQITEEARASILKRLKVTRQVRC